MWRLCPEGKLLFYHCIQRRHARTRIETKASLDDLGGKLSWFLHPDRNVTEARRWDVMVFFYQFAFPPCFVDPAWWPLRGSGTVICEEGGGPPRSPPGENVLEDWEFLLLASLPTMTESRQCLFFSCLSEITASLVIWNKMFDSAGHEECKLHFHHHSLTDQMQILGGYRAWSKKLQNNTYFMPAEH